nr:PorP/SprF family type IX secretion system membrane protein [Saprospiraceae bacterium]
MNFNKYILYLLTSCTFVFLLCIGSNLNAQQSPHFSLSPSNKFQFNAAVSAFDNSMVISGVHRDQWNNIPGGPNTQLINAHMPLEVGMNAVGFQFVNDAIGIEKTLSFSFSYAHLITTGYGPLSLAVQLGGEQKTFDQSRLRTPGGNYNEEIPNHNDPILGNSDLSSWLPTLGLSAWYSRGNMDLGLSVKQLTSGGHFSGEPFSYSMQPEVSVYGDYFLPIDESWAVIPSIHIYTDLKQVQNFVHGLVGYENQYFGGLGLRGLGTRTFDAIAIMAGVRLNDRFTVYYNYDLGVSNIYRPNNQTHEFMVVYRSLRWTGHSKKPPVIYNPRFLE